MRLVHLTLHNFRNYVRLELDLPAGATLLTGGNAQGKTNLLEAVYYLATSRSPRAGADREVVNWLALEQEPLPYARLVGRVERGAPSTSPEGRRELTLEMTLTQQANSDNRYSKQIRLNGVPRRAMDILGQLNVVLFGPEDIALVSDSPSRRRRYLDAMLCQIDPAYCRTLAHYNQVVSQRNALLRDLRERGGNADQLHFWDQRLVDQGAHLLARRREAVQSLDGLAHDIHANLTGGQERLRLRYAPGVALEGQATLSAIHGAFQEQLGALRRREVAAGVTLLGPHRDEMRFLINEADAGVYGSRGQQRTAALALKLAEVDLVRREAGERPVLLLDDVFSELDEDRRRFLLGWLGPAEGLQQSIITTTDWHTIPETFLASCRLWHVQGGRLTEASPTCSC
jgi:DNA replication and repair protein RecF